MWLEDLPREALNQAPIDWSTDMPPEEAPNYDDLDKEEQAPAKSGKPGKPPATAPTLGGKAGAPPKAGAKP
jgi:hypothetical protein